MRHVAAHGPGRVGQPRFFSVFESDRRGRVLRAPGPAERRAVFLRGGVFRRLGERSRSPAERTRGDAASVRVRDVRRASGSGNERRGRHGGRNGDEMVRPGLVAAVAAVAAVVAERAFASLPAATPRAVPAAAPTAARAARPDGPARPARTRGFRRAASRRRRFFFSVSLARRRRRALEVRRRGVPPPRAFRERLFFFRRAGGAERAGSRGGAPRLEEAQSRFGNGSLTLRGGSVVRRTEKRDLFRRCGRANRERTVAVVYEK